MFKTIVIVIVTLIGLAYSVAPKVHIENNRVRVQENGITREYGRIRDVKSTRNKTEIYTNKNYSSPAVTLHKDGSIATKRDYSSKESYCKYSCSTIIEDDEDEDD